MNQIKRRTNEVKLQSRELLNIIHCIKITHLIVEEMYGVFVEFERETLQEGYVVGHHLGTEYRSDRSCIVLIIAKVNVTQRNDSCYQGVASGGVTMLKVQLANNDAQNNRKKMKA